MISKKKEGEKHTPDNKIIKHKYVTSRHLQIAIFVSFCSSPSDN